MDLITLKTFDSTFEAYNLKNLLETEGINAFIYDEHLIGVNPLYSNAIGGVKVKIRESDFNCASQILSAINNNDYVNDTEDLITCNKCNSVDINVNYRDFKNFFGLFSMIASFILFVYPIYYKRKCKCNNCGNEFILSES